MTRTGDLTTSDSAVTNDQITGELPAAVLWDMDGTLVDTEPYWFAAERDLVDRFGHGDWPDEHAHAMVGFDLRDSAAYMQEHGGVDLPTDEIVERLLDGVIARLHREIPWRPGGRELLAELNDAGVPCALVTMSWRRFVDPVMAALPNDSFVATVTGDEVPLGRGKPNPDPYLIAADACGAAPEYCLAIEDSPTGVRSALDAGCRVLGVPNVRALRREPRLTIVDSLADVRANDLTMLNGIEPGEAGLAATDFDPGLRNSPATSRIGAHSGTGVSGRRHRSAPRWLLAVAVIVVGVVGALLGSRLLANDGAEPTPSLGTPPAPTTDPWLTFPEGLTIEQMTELMSARRPDLDARAFIAAIAAAVPPRELARPEDVTSMEGLLFPNTYRVGGPGDESGLVQQMVGLTERVAVLEEGLVNGARELGLSPYEVLIVASMVEEEARLDGDRPKIARVIYNRLARDMTLQIDATLYYGRSRDTPFSELRNMNSPYNTYENRGLPPTPISNPGRASINAAINPAANPLPDDPLCEGLAATDCAYIYYVRADELGNHVFAATYDQHLANVDAAREAGVL